MSWFKKITSLFSSETEPAKAEEAKPENSSEVAPSVPSKQDVPDIPGWSGPETRDSDMFQAVCRLMEWIIHPAFGLESYHDGAFQEHLDQLEKGREYPDLIAVLRRTMLHLGDHNPLIARLAQVYTDAYDNASAAELWKRLNEADYNSAEANFRLGELAEREEQMAEASAYYQRALAFDVHYPNAWQRAEKLKRYLPMPRNRAAVTMGGVTSGGVGGNQAMGVGVRPPDGFELRHPLGRGGYGTVYLARDMHLHRDVAIKFLHPHLTQDSRRVDAFFEEARLVARLSIPGAVRIFDLDQHERVIIMEYLTRGTLRDRLASGRPLSLQAALRVASALLMTLGRIHNEGLVHRDIKPENILFRSDGSAVLGDFGVATLEAEDGLVEARAAGTLAYMAPELKKIGVSAQHAADRRVDMYSIGLVLVEMLAGFLPNASAMSIHDPDTLISTLPTNARGLLASTLRRVLAVEPRLRHSDAHQLLKAVQEVQEQLTRRDEDRELLEDFEKLVNLGGPPDPATLGYLAMLQKDLGS